MKIIGGRGFWYIDKYPIGGKFGRAPEGGIECTVIRTWDRGIKGVHGTNAEVLLADGQKAAVDLAHTTD
jgi:hypothetical protein